VHRRDPMLDEDLEAVAAVAEHDDADGGPDRHRLGVGDTAAPAGAVGQVRTIAALGVDVSDHARRLRSRSGLLPLSPSMPASVRTSDGGVVPITSAHIGRDGPRRGAAGAEERRCPWSEGMAVGVRETGQDTMERDEIFNLKRRTQPMTNKGGAERANYEQLRDLSVLRDRPGVAELADLRSPSGRPRDSH